VSAEQPERVISGRMVVDFTMPGNSTCAVKVNGVTFEHPRWTQSEVMGALSLSIQFSAGDLGRLGVRQMTLDEALLDFHNRHEAVRPGRGTV